MAIPPPPGPDQPPYPSYPGPSQSHPQYPQAHPQYPQPYPQGPYAPWSQGYSPYNRPTPVNGVAIASLVLGILCFLPALGLVLGIVALVQIRKNGERGKGMAITGSVLSTVGLLLWALLLGTGGLSSAWDGFKDAAKEDNSSFSLAKGDCFDSLDGSLEGLAYDVDPVPCSGAHDGEVFASFRMPAGAYPGDDRVTEVADDKCYALEDRYAMDAWAVPDDVDVYYLTPTSQSWRLGDHEITCVFGNVDANGSLTGSLRKDETTLDADQLTYLKAAHLLNTAMDTAPDAEFVEDDLPGHKKWAQRVADALDEQTRLLTAHRFAATASPSVAALVKDLRSARQEWAKAARATDADTFYDHYDTGSELLDVDRTVTPRKALGLATTPPSYEQNGDGGGSGDGDGGTGDGGEGDAGIEV
ncbi:DUF4190 domain-containing protein [Streptomyces turgidiscabies]|uniref:Septum formation-related domain-containing protein n=2 Tax=Streptomyces TaxID=1883 RepID=L7F3Z5_STRT8|nr:DUF4190 domain-containing protein [Streptomyces turgidiscabies]ELP65350.1 hypothetical protein STRTUCAR8_07197 [Streptomyces turgidiscabies Car8]MDX3495304.1 DUF4190 domain-containing protein [Streptomyces turgidiscabies]GAQ69990.1 hypothetical protein T45_01722 [Streptomyces turgidiscabies]